MVPHRFPTQTSMDQRRLSTGLSMRVFEHGQGEPVLFLHGMPELAISWSAQLAMPGWRMIAPDMPGYGGSDCPKALSEYRVERLAEHLLALCDVLDVPSVHLVGHDWGAVVAWQMAAMAPERLRTLSVLNGPPAGLILRAFLRDPRQLIRSHYMFWMQIPWAFEWRLRRRPDLVREVFRDFAHDPEIFTDDALAPYVEQARSTGLVGGLAYYRAAFRYPSLQLPQVEVPVQLLWGVHDPAFGIGLSRPDRYASFTRDFRVHELDTGHWVQQEAPERVNAHLEAFWREHSP